MTVRPQELFDVTDVLEPIRRRPAMYIGEATAERSLCSRLVESVARNAATDHPAPTNVRIIVWAENVVTVAFDGAPLPVAPYVDPIGTALPHPEIYRMFLHVAAPATRRPLSFAGAVVNALSERLVVWTRHDDVTYRVGFRGGGLVALLAASKGDRPLDTNGLTFRPDAALVPGVLTFDGAAAIASRLAADATPVRISAVDRSAERAP